MGRNLEVSMSRSAVHKGKKAVPTLRKNRPLKKIEIFF